MTDEERQRILSMTEEEIEAAALADPDNPLWTDEELAEARRTAGGGETAGLTSRNLHKIIIVRGLREHSLTKVPVLLVVGRREADERRVSIRRLESQAQTG